MRLVNHAVAYAGQQIPKIGWSKTSVSSQTDILMAATKFSDYLGLNQYKKAKKL